MSEKMRRYTPSQVERAGLKAWCAHADVSELETRVTELEEERAAASSSMGTVYRDMERQRRNIVELQAQLDRATKPRPMSDVPRDEQWIFGWSKTELAWIHTQWLSKFTVLDAVYVFEKWVPALPPPDQDGEEKS